MVKVKINFDKESIEKAIAKLKETKKKMQKDVVDLFLTKCLEWIRDRANFYLSNLSMDSEITTDIQVHWDIQDVSSNVKKLVNTSDKATFVEFGVGSVGQKNEHPQATSENYEYNVPSRYKHSDGSWVFNAKGKEYAIDLNEGYFGVYQRQNSGKVVVVTKGSPANLYLYNAGMDLWSSGHYHKIWAECLKKLL